MLKHAYTVRIIIETGGLLCQTSHSNIESRRQQWLDDHGVKEPTRIVSKDKAQLPVQIMDDIISRQSGLARGSNNQGSIRSAA